MRTGNGRQRFYAAGWVISAGVMVVVAEHLDSLDPSKQLHVDLGHLERDLGTPQWIGLERQRLLEPRAGGLPACGDLRPTRLAQTLDPSLDGRWLGQATREQICCRRLSSPN